MSSDVAEPYEFIHFLYGQTPRFFKMANPKKSLSNFEWRCLDLVKKAEKFIEDRKDNGLSPRNMKVAE